MFAGRIGVAHFWKGMIILIVLGFVGMALVGLSALASFLFFGEQLSLATLEIDTPAPALVALGVFGVVVAAMCVFGLGLLARRLHDLELSGWLALFFPIVAILNIIFFPALWAEVLAGFAALVWFFATLCPGSGEVNHYGEPLKYRSAWAAFIGQKKGALFLAKMEAVNPRPHAPPGSFPTSEMLFPKVYAPPPKKRAPIASIVGILPQPPEMKSKMEAPIPSPAQVFSPLMLPQGQPS